MTSSHAASQSLKAMPSEDRSRKLLIIVAAVFIATVPFELSHLLALLIGAASYWLITEAKRPQRAMNKAPVSKYVDRPCVVSKNGSKDVATRKSQCSHKIGSSRTPSPTLKAEDVPQKLPGELRNPPSSELKPRAGQTTHVFKGTEWEAQVEEIIEKLVPTKSTEETVMKIANCVQQRLQPLFGSSAEVTGFVSGCISCESVSYGVSVPDVDVVVNVDPQALSKLPLNGKQKADKAVLKACLDAVMRSGGFKFRRFYFRGREPSIVVMVHPSLGLCDKSVAVSISINAITPLYNAALMAECARFDSRAKQLILLVRRWAKDRGICHVFKDYLPPYAWTQLTIFFLQAGLVGSGGLLPPVEMFEAFSKLSPNEAKSKPWQPSSDACHKSVAELFGDFFHFYATEFNWQKCAVSARLGKIAAPWVKLPLHILRADGKTMQVGPIIEDPFEVTHNFGDCMNAESFARTHQEFMRANELCKKGALLSELLEPWLEGEDADQ